ncbi:hypothetical protein EIP91_001371 [Steccherinum ochraceum]|uniref:F-box domain-containing protein n=1 Tax=Steccherinum ochraceum TaxID=92696 RepID=A0A4R0RKH7_9APHY|nr:hypothetical protein EIP91_001371 [Steccherinum ochraceum]
MATPCNTTRTSNTDLRFREFPIPNELLYYIVDNFHDDLVSLKACSLVSQAWHPAARTHILSSILIYTHRDDDTHDLAAFVHFLASHQSIRPLVKKLKMTSEHPYVYDVYSLLLQLPICRTLILYGCAIQRSAPADLPIVPFPHFDALRFRGCSFSHSHSFRTAFQLIHLFGIVDPLEPPHRTCLHSLQYCPGHLAYDFAEMALESLEFRYVKFLQIVPSPSMIGQNGVQRFLDSAAALKRFEYDIDNYAPRSTYVPPSLRNCTELDEMVFILQPGGRSWGNADLHAAVNLGTASLILESLPRDAKLSAVFFDLGIRCNLVEDYQDYVERIEWKPVFQSLRRVSCVTHVDVLLRYSSKVQLDDATRKKLCEVIEQTFERLSGVGVHLKVSCVPTL